MKYSIYILSFLVLIIGCSEDRLGDSDVGTITGTVIADGTNEKLANVKISTQPSTSTVFTDANGLFSIESVADESYSVQADLDGYVSQFEIANVTNGTLVELVFEMKLEETDNTAPTIPELLLPEDNAVDVPTEIELVWSSMDENEDDDVNYTVTLYNDANDDVAVFESVVDTTLVVQDLLYSTRYFWQVAATDNVNEPVQSPLFNFKTTTLPKLNILFVKEINGNNVIFSTDEEGNELRLTDLDVNSFRPRRNSITKKIAFLRTIGGNVHIFTMDEDGNNQTQITNSQPVQGFSFDELDYTWSPQGDFLLYPAFTKLYRIAENGTGLTTLYETTNGNFVTNVDWSRFNDVIAVKTNNSEGYNVEIFTVNTAGDVQDVILSGVPGGAGGVNLNVDGTQLLYYYDTSGSELPNYSLQDARMFIYNILANTSVELATEVETGYLNIDPRFSPNEDKVIYTHKGRGFNEPSQVYVHDFNDDNVGFEVIAPEGKMPDWENQ
ncbi:tolB protein [unidentified eubacterium SCB49]|nr:tolB protein [unidentified eubacterium SCB49]